jgi:hypothetical protein
MLTTPSGASIPEFPNPRPEVRPIEHTPEGEPIGPEQQAAKDDAARKERDARLDSLIQPDVNLSEVRAATEAREQHEAARGG